MPKAIVWIIALFLISLATLASSSSPAQPSTKVDIKAVTQAIEDEVYDFGYQDWDFGYIGKTIGTDEQQIRVYVSPLETNANMGGPNKPFGYIIYKYMPFGEVLRLFWFNKKGLAILGGNPELGFPPENPNYLTVYMDDDELSRDKATWLKASFVIQIHPSAQRLHDAAERQKERIGYSVRLDPSHRIYPPGHDPRCAVN